MKDTTGQVYISIRKPKLEIGSKATPWTLAPQEIANEIDVNISEVKSQIDQTANGIISSVESNYYNKSYINNELNAEYIEKVLCHELTHAAMFSYNIDLTLEQEEILADLIATYGQEIVHITNLMFKRIMEKRGKH